jgi:iron complex outermembrane recepter protein
VLFTTAPPTNKWEGYVDVKGGNYHLGSVEAALNVPIVDDKVLLRVAGYSEYHQGYQYDALHNLRHGDLQRDAIRTSLIIKPADNFSNKLVVDYTHSGGSNMSPVLYYVLPPGVGNPSLPANLYFSPALDSIIHFPGA